MYVNRGKYSLRERTKLERYESQMKGGIFRFRSQDEAWRPTYHPKIEVLGVCISHLWSPDKARCTKYSELKFSGIITPEDPKFCLLRCTQNIWFLSGPFLVMTETHAFVIHTQSAAMSDVSAQINAQSKPLLSFYDWINVMIAVHADQVTNINNHDCAS